MKGLKRCQAKGISSGVCPVSKWYLRGAVYPADECKLGTDTMDSYENNVELHLSG